MLRPSLPTYLLAGALVSGAFAPAFSQANPRFFLGKVQELDQPRGAFVISGGASKKYPHPRIHLDRTTKWSGPNSAAHKLHIGDFIRVDVSPAANGEFRASAIAFQVADHPPKASNRAAGPAR